MSREGEGVGKGSELGREKSWELGREKSWELGIRKGRGAGL